MDTSAMEYDRKFAEMQKYIPFLENMIDRLKTVDKPRAPQLDKIQSLYNIVTNTKKKLKYETLIKCEEGLKKLYEKVGKADTTKVSNDYNRDNYNFNFLNSNLPRSQNNVDCSSAPASPSPPSTPEPAPKAPILIPTERRISPIREIRPIKEDIRSTLDRRYNSDRDKKSHHHDSHKHKKHHSKLEDEKRRSDSSRPVINYTDVIKSPSGSNADNDFGIYNKAITHKNNKKDNKILSPPLNEPPLSSADLEDLLLDNDSQKNEQLDITQLENIRKKLVSQINNLSETNTSDDKDDLDDEPKKSVLVDKKKDTKLEKQQCSKNTEGENKDKSKIIMAGKKESENKFGNLLSSIDEQIFEQKKKELKKVDVKKESKAKPEKIEKEKSNHILQAKVEKKDDDIKKIESEKVENENENKMETSYVRLADKYQRKPRSDKPLSNDATPDEVTMSLQDKAPGNITGRGLTMKELERFGAFEAQQQQQSSNFSPPHNPNVFIYPNDPRLKRNAQPQPPSHMLAQNQSAMPWLQQSVNQMNNPTPQIYPDLYSPGPPSTSQDSFPNRNIYNNVQVPLQDTYPPPLMQNFNQNKNFHQYNQNLQSPYDIQKMNPITYYENSSQYHSNNQPTAMKPYSSKPPLLSPPSNQSPIYNNNLNQNLYNIQTIPSLLSTAPKVPPPIPPPTRNDTIRPITRDPRDPRRRAYDVTNTTTDRYNTNRNTNRPPPITTEKKVFRGYDPRPQPRKKEPEKVSHSDVKIDGISNIPIAGALNSFKIPKIKREEKIVEMESEKTETVDKIEADTSNNEAIKKENDHENAIQTENVNVTQNPEISSNSNENDIDLSKEKNDKTEIKDKVDSKEDLINNFVRKLCESGETDTFLAVLERLGETISKTRMKRIMNSESDESDEEDKKKTKKNDEKKQSVVDSTNIDIKDSDDSVDKKIKHKTKSDKSTTKDKSGKAKRRNGLEMLQDDIRDMFICKGVLTATGQRMCRLLKEDEDDNLTSSLNLNNARSLRSRKEVLDDDTNVSPLRRTNRITRQSKILDKDKDKDKDDILSEVSQRRTRLPRVLIEKTDFETIRSSLLTRRSISNSSVSSVDEKEIENVSKRSRTQRKTIAKTASQLKESKEMIEKSLVVAKEGDEENVSVNSLFLKRNINNYKAKKHKERSRIILTKKIADVIQNLIKNNGITLKNQDLNSIFGKIDTEVEETTIDSIKPTPSKSGKRRKINRRGKAWSTGVIKKKAKKISESEKDKDETITTVTSETENKVENIPEDIKPSINYTDKDYCFNGSGKYSCILCGFSGKTIVFHYKTAHPNDEVLISRVSEDVAKQCIEESIENNYEMMEQKEEVLKCVGYRRKRFTGFVCQFCDSSIKNDFTQTFYDHLATHTGENSFKCTFCKFTTISKPSLRAHVSYSHPGKKFSYITIYPPCKNYPILLGYLCSECNFVQLHEENTLEHIKRYHKNGDKLVRIYKVNMSSIQTETVDKIITEQLKKETIEKNEPTAIEDEKSDKNDSVNEETVTTKDTEDDKKIPLDDLPEIESKKEIPEESTESPLKVDKTPEKVTTELQQKERELNVFVCPDELLDEQKIQDERLKIMQEVAEAVCQTRRTSFQFLDTLKSKLESKDDEKVTNTENVDGGAEAESSSKFLDTLKSKLERYEKASEVSNNKDTEDIPLSKVPPSSVCKKPILSKKDIETPPDKETSNKINSNENDTKEKSSPNSIEVPGIFENDDDLDAGLIDEVLNMENDWSKWNLSKTNSTMMNTIQRLASVVKQSNDTTLNTILSSTPSETIKYYVGPVCAHKTNNSIQFFCSSSAVMCSFSTNDKDLFSTHVTEKHLDFWDGECGKCEDNIQTDSKKLTCKDALEHLFTFHLELSLSSSTSSSFEDDQIANITSDETNPPMNKPVIRMRKLSGDKLSMSPVADDRNNTDTESSNDLLLKNMVTLSDQSDIAFKIQDVRTLSADEIESSPVKSERKVQSKVTTAVFALSPIKTNPLNRSPGGPTLLTTVPILVPLNPLKSSPTPDKIGVSKASPTPTKTPKIITKRLYINKQMAHKDTKVLQKLLDPPKLAHIFKCMAKFCTFTTDEANTFLWHLNSDKSSMHMSAKDWGICPYCAETNLTNAKRLETHILQEHGECRFQCGYCFYRAASQTLVERHQCEHHGSENFRVYQLDIRGDYNEYKKQLPLKSICNPYICPFESCKAEIYLRENFLEHIETHPDMESYECKLCREKCTSPVALAQHFIKHQIGFIQCLYCIYCAEYEHTMKAHLGVRHPNQSPKVLFRKINPALKSVLKISEPLLNSESTSILRHLFICNLDLKTTHFSTAILIPSTTTSDFNFGSPQSETTTTSTPPSSSLNDNLLLLLNENDSSTTTAAPVEQEVLEDDTNDENSHLNELIESTLKETENGGKPDFDLFKDNITENSKDIDIPLVVNLDNSDEDIDVENTAIDPLAFDENIIKSSSSEVVDTKIEIKDVSVEQFKDESIDDINDKSDIEKTNQRRAIHSIDDIQHTGLCGKALYRCGTTNCEFSADNLANFKDHLFVCDTSTDSSLFRCFHCKKSIKYLTSLIDHIKRHGLARYGCSLCYYRSAISSYVVKHMKEKHKISNVRTIPLDPFKTDIENDLFVVCPQGKTTTLKRKNSSKDFEVAAQNEVKMIFAPNEVNLLPRQPISPFDMKCGQCSYMTKVRTNMVRHLLFHSNSIAVPESAPVNPVPCLEKNEKMFDKMVNLANSSFTAESSRMGSKTAVRKSSISNEDLQDLPGFVPENKRFVCGANGCNYLTVDDSMLRCHFRALHMDEINYKCPHCPDHLGVVVSIDKIGIHLKMHDTRLYKCSHCAYYHYQKYVVERHLSEKHSDKIPYAHTVRELDVDGKEERKDTSVEIISEELRDNKPWKCGLCKFKTVTRTEIIDHAKSAHAVKSQFMCSLCQYKCSYDKTFDKHFNAKHPGQPVDMISVYYKEDVSVVEPPVVTSTPTEFDTTPLWRRDMPRIRHIRGILFEETQTKQVSPRKSSSKNENKNHDEFIDYVEDGGGDNIKKNKNENKRRKSIVTSDLLNASYELLDKSGEPNNADLAMDKNILLNITYTCSICDKFTAKGRKEFAEHLCQEMNYEKFICTYCSKKSHSFDWMKCHLETAHGKPWKPEFIVSLTVDDSIESFILNEINRQEEDACGNSSDYKKIENLKHIFGFPSDNRHHINNSSVHTTSTETMLDDSEYEEVDETSSTHIKKIKEIVEDIFVDPRQTDKNKCPHCSYFSKYPRDVTKHIIRHWEIQPYECGHCGLKGNSISEIIKHNTQRHNIRCKIIKICDPRNIKVREMQRPRRKADDLESSPSLTPEVKKIALEIPSNLQENDMNKEDDEEDKFIEDSTPGDENKKIVYLCHYCPKQGDTVKKIYEHWTVTHKEKFAKSTFKFRALSKNQIPPRVRGRCLCKICGYRGSKQNVLKHHKQIHPGQQLQIDDTPPSEGTVNIKPTVRINCKNCLYYCYSLVMMEEHYGKVHNSSNDFKNKFAEELSKQEVELSKNKLPVLCKWCQEICKDEEAATSHHMLFHSHLNLSITPVKSSSTLSSLKYCCPTCSHTSESHISMLEHLRGHVKPFVCGHCDVGFSFPHHVKIHTVKKHPGLEPKYEAVEILQQKLNELRNSLRVILEDGTLTLYNEYKSAKRKSEDEPSSSLSNKVIKLNSGNIIKKSPVAKKSTTFVPEPIKKRIQVAKKSTTPHVKPIVARTPSPSPLSSPAAPSTTNEKEQYYSFYGRKPITNNSNITTTMNLGGTQMKVNISTLMQLTNMAPILRVADLKNQKMIL